MSDAIKVCNCFFDAGVYCQMKDSSYGEFFSVCMKERDDRKTSFLITSHDDCCFIVCCMDFFKTTIKISGLKKLNPLLVSNYFCFCC